MDDQTTQEAPAQSPRPPSGDLLQLLVDALNEVQNTSSGLIQALFSQNYDEISIYAHDAHSWWQVAKAVFERLAIRARVAATSGASGQVRHAVHVLDVTYETLNQRMVAAMLTVGVPSIGDELQQLQHSLALSHEPRRHEDERAPRAAAPTLDPPCE